MARDNRLFVDAVLYQYRVGIPWRDLPERFGDFRVVHLRHSCWSKSGVWERIFAALAHDADNEYVMIDSTIVRAHQHSAGAKRGRQTLRPIGRSRGSLSIKIRATVDALGDLTVFISCPGRFTTWTGRTSCSKISGPRSSSPTRRYNSQARVIE
jgi:transposase